MERWPPRGFSPTCREAIRLPRVHRTKFVQPLPLVRAGLPGGRASRSYLMRPFQILNTSMLRCATLNNDEVVAFVDRFVRHAGSPRGTLETTPDVRRRRAGGDGADGQRRGPGARASGKPRGASARETHFRDGVA